MATDVLETLKKLPRHCYAALPSNARMIIRIDRGVPGYTPGREYETAEATEAEVKRRNDLEGVTSAQLEAMLAGSMFGWHVPGADPDTYRPPLPPDPDGLNGDRADWAERALEAFMEATGTDPCDAISDLVADLLHLCDRKGDTYGNCREMIERGFLSYADEIVPLEDETEEA